MRAVMAITFCILLAGCSQPPEEASEDEFADLGVTQDTLAIRGVVVDTAIVPLAGVQVAMQDRATETDADGRFAFADVEPGVYIVEVTKVGYHTAQTTVTVVDADDPIARIQMEANPGSVPYYETSSVRGLLECGMGLPGGGSYSTCQTPIGVIDILCDTSGGAVCLPYVNDHRGILEMEVTSPPDFAQAEAVWRATSSTSEVLTWSSWSRTRGTLEFNNGTTHTGASPVIIPWDKPRLIDGDVGGDQLLVFQVYPESGGIGNVVLQQKVEILLTVFYNFAPDDGWTLSGDGEPERPA